MAIASNPIAAPDQHAVELQAPATTRDGCATTEARR